MEPQPQPPQTTSALSAVRPELVDVPASSTHPPISHRARLASIKTRALAPLSRLHSRTPYIRTLPLPALLIIALLVLVNLLVWAICALIILLHHPQLISTAALAY